MKKFYPSANCVSFFREDEIAVVAETQSCTMFRHRISHPMVHLNGSSILNSQSRLFMYLSCSIRRKHFVERGYDQIRCLSSINIAMIFAPSERSLTVNRLSPFATQKRPLSSMSLKERINAAMTNFLLENSPAEKKIKKKDRKERAYEKLKSESGMELLENFQNYVVFESIDEANSWALKVLNELLEKESTATETVRKPLYIGIHVGWNSRGSKREKRVTQLISISFPNQPVACLNLFAMGVRDHTSFPKAVRALLQLPYIKPCGLLVRRYLSRLKRYFHVMIPTRIELDKFAVLMEPKAIKEAIRCDLEGYLDIFAAEDKKNKNKKKLPSMKVLCSKYLNVEIDGTIGEPHTLNYFQDPIPAQIIKYSTLDAYHCRCLGETMVNTLENDITVPQPSTKFQVGTKVKVYIGSKVDHVAEGVIEYLGGVNGESVPFGLKMINNGMTLVRLTEVHAPHKMPKYALETFMVYGFQWTRDVTLESILSSKLPLIAIDLKRLVRLDEVDANLYVEKPKKVKPKKLSPRKRKEQNKRKQRKLERRLESMNFEKKLADTYWDF
jgi:hypothetical protein